MKTFKSIDVIIQLVLIGFSLVYVLASPDIMESAIRVYFVVGPYQVLSCVIQMVAGFNQARKSARSIYRYILLGLAVLAALTYLVNPFIILLTLLYISPLLAFYYLGVSIAETVKMRGPKKLPGSHRTIQSGQL